jgi:hypothetical protein
VRRHWLGLLLILAVPGCWSPVTDLVTPHVEPGGSISATLDSGPALTTKALVDATATPMTLNGTSAALVFGLVIGTDDTTGLDGKAQLLAGDPVTLSISATSTTQMSVYLGGAGCATTAAVIHLTPTSGKVSGDFVGSGANDCETSGTFTNVPIDQGE